MNNKTTRLVAMVTGLAALGSFASSLPATAQAPPAPCNRPGIFKPDECKDNPKHGWDMKSWDTKSEESEEGTGQEDEKDKKSDNSDRDGEGRPPWQNRPY